VQIQGGTAQEKSDREEKKLEVKKKRGRWEEGGKTLRLQSGQNKGSGQKITKAFEGWVELFKKKNNGEGMSEKGNQGFRIRRAANGGTRKKNDHTTTSEKNRKEEIANR